MNVSPQQESFDPHPNPLPARERGRRRGRRRFWTLAIIAILLAGGAIALHLSLPSIVRNQIRDVLTKAGYPDASFDVEKATAFGVRVANVRAGKHGELTISSAKVDYSPLVAMAGRVDAVKIENANILIDFDALVPHEDQKPTTQTSSDDGWTATNAKGLPVDRFDLRNCNVTLAHGDKRLNVRLDGVLWRETWDGDRARVSLQLRNGRTLTTLDGSIDYNNHTIDASSTINDMELAGVFPFFAQDGELSSFIREARGATRMVVNLWYANGQPHTDGSLELREGKFVGGADYGITLEGVFVSIVMKSFVPPLADQGQRIEVKRVSFGDDRSNDLADVRIELAAPSAEQILVSRLSCEWAGGRVRATSPVPVNPAASSAAINLALEKIGLNQFLKLVSGGRASGEGTLSGELPVSVEWPRITIGTGQIRSDSKGVFHFGGQVTDLAANIARSERRLRGQEQQLIDALTDFQYDQIVFDFQRTDQGLKVVTHVSGRGLRGTKTPLDLTINYTGLEEALNAYLGTGLRVKNSGD